MRLTPLVTALTAGLLVAGCGSSAKAHSSGPTHIYRIRSSGMEPTLRCARPSPGCTAKTDDLIVARLSGSAGVKRGDILVFTTPRRAAMDCGEGGTFVKRVIGLPGETVHEDRHGFIDIDGRRLDEPYIPAASRLSDTFHFGATWHVPNRHYFVMGDNRPESCDSRVWGGVPAHNVIGPVTRIFRDGKSSPVS